jgi:lipoprotein-releasing system permease protein
VLRGMFWGNLIGIGLCLLQKYGKFIRLSEANYYLSYAPIELSMSMIILLNVGTLLLTLIFLIIPSYLVSRISPVKAIRFS